MVVISFVHRKIFDLNIKITKKSHQIFNIKIIVDKLNKYDLISFDIFDTLITRRVYAPKDVFRLVEKKIKNKYNLEIDFLNIREKAGDVARNKKNEFSTIDDIYDEIFLMLKVSKEILDEIKQIEINTEIDVCVPRVDILKIFNQLKTEGKKIILVSDMYLTSDILNNILQNSGYSGYSDLWVSCEKGARKDDGKLWDLFFRKFGDLKTIHVGDDKISDIKNVKKRGRDVFYVNSPVSLFKLSNLYKKFKRYEKENIGNSIILGMFINCGIYNSPFAYYNKNYIEKSEELGFIALGPLLCAFVKNIDEGFSSKKSPLLFLSREGYFLQKIFNTYIEKTRKEKTDSIYFLASRRAVSVPSIENKKDVIEIIKQNYNGSLLNLIKERLGVSLDGKISDLNISMPYDLSYAIRMIEPHLNVIFTNAKKEKITLVKYIKNVTEGNINNLTVFDVGYSGTIQYYLSKILNKKVGGYYICTVADKKPKRIDCEINALYDLTSQAMVDGSKLFKGSLFLESVLRAPQGQLIRFVNDREVILPLFNEDKNIPDGVAKIQDGILRYCVDYSKIVKDFYSDVVLDKELVEDIFYLVFLQMNLSEHIIESLNVSDFYSSNGVLKFNSLSKKWSI